MVDKTIKVQIRLFHVRFALVALLEVYDTADLASRRRLQQVETSGDTVRSDTGFFSRRGSCLVRFCRLTNHPSFR